MYMYNRDNIHKRYLQPTNIKILNKNESVKVTLCVKYDYIKQIKLRLN